MKKIILTVIVILACAVNAQTEPPKGTEWQKSSGRNKESADVVYRAKLGTVQFDYSWGGPDPNPNQMWTYQRTDINNGWKYEGGAFEFTSKYVWTDFDTQLDERKGKPGNIVEYGYYTIGNDGSTSDLISLVTKYADGTTVENSVIFQEGDKIGIYLTIDEKNGNQITFTSTKTDIEGTTAAAPNVDTHSRGKENQYFCLFDPRNNQGIGDYSHYEYYLGGLLASSGQTYEEFLEDVEKINEGKTNITENPSNPVSGQPLPGTLATLLIGSLCASALRKKNQK